MKGVSLVLYVLALAFFALFLAELVIRPLGAIIWRLLT